MRFGYNLSTSVRDDARSDDDARDAEALGYDFVCLSDHLHGSHPTYETWTLLTWIAAATERVHLVPNVLGLPYRSPAVLAKMAESLQRLSGGRLVLGLGAGGMDAEFEAFGLPVRRPGEKVAALDDALAIMQGMWSTAGFTHQGEQYGVAGAELEPKPEVSIPIWIGGNGPRVLSLIGRRADGWIPSLPFAPPEVVPERRDRIRRAADEAGRDPDGFTFVYNVGVQVGEHRDDPRLVSGSPDQVAEQLGGFEALGFHAINVWPAGDEAEQRQRIATEVLPLLRGGGR